MNNDYLILKNDIGNIKKSILKDKKKLLDIKKHKSIHEKAKQIISSSVYEIQSSFQINIEKTMNSVLNYIWDDRKYEFKMEAKEKIDSFEWQPKLFLNGEELSLKHSNPQVGAPINIIGVVFKIMFHLLKNSRNVLFFDEPAPGLGKASYKFGEMLKFLNEKFGTQIIISTHDENLSDVADIKYRVKIRNGISHIEQID